jgi:hypothetical protein
MDRATALATSDNAFEVHRIQDALAAVVGPRRADRASDSLLILAAVDDHVGDEVVFLLRPKRVPPDMSARLLAAILRVSLVPVSSLKCER